MKFLQLIKKGAEAPEVLEEGVLYYDENTEAITCKKPLPPVDPEITITVVDTVEDTSIIALTADKTVTVQGEIVWTAEATQTTEGELDVEISGGTLKFKKHFTGSVKLTATATNASDEKTITVSCSEIATAYTYSVRNVSSPSVNWSATSATINFTGVTTAHYALKADTEVTSQETQLVEFEQNTPQGDNPMQFTANTEFVDLGLPSGLKWAKCNLGATEETGYGAYFSWGDTNGYAKPTDKGGTSTARDITDKFLWNDVEVNYTVKQGGASGSGFTWSTAPFNNGSSSYDATYFASVKDTVCPNGVLAAEYDAATVNMGGDWRMPTMAEYEELTANTTSTWKTVNGVAGRKFTSKAEGNTNYIFIPAAGYCNNGSFGYVGSSGYVWTSSLSSDNLSSAWDLYFYSGNVSMYSYYYRYDGFSVRAVSKN